MGGGRRSVDHRYQNESAAVRLSQVENVIVGAPCGVMDQDAASICGEAGSLMALLCQPAEHSRAV